MRRLLERKGDRPTAVFGASDVLALGAMEAARGAGLSIPNDIAIAGFDDIPVAKLLGLTTVRQPVMGMAAAAVALLTDELKRRRLGPVEFTQVLQDHALVVRESTGPAR